jgi:hypothetical protein
MADTQVKDETAATVLNRTDRFYVVQDPTGTPLNRYGTPALLSTRVAADLGNSIFATIDGGGSVITTGIKGDIMIPAAATITKVTMLADQSGSIVVDLWKDTYANFPPTDADSITASAPPTITTATKSQDSTLTGWSTGKNIAAGDIIRFNVDSCTSITRLHIIIEVSR